MEERPAETRQNPVRVVIDHRETESGVPEALELLGGVNATFAHLDLGDYLVNDTFLFERKSLPDLALSIQDGRLFRQAWALATLPSPNRGVLILEGTSSDLASVGMRREAIQGALITTTVFFGIPLLRAATPEETARLMIYTARQAKTLHIGALPRHAKRPKGKRRAQLMMLQGLPGVGPSRAERLLERFGSVEAVMTAAVEELAKVEGVGKRTAEAIRWVLREPKAPYG